MTNLDQAVAVAKKLIRDGRFIAGHHQRLGRLHVIKELRERFDMGFAAADMVYTLAKNTL